ncbi:helix-turn-helix domain-containing protein [Paraburkholderia fungorum]|uniref:helix-turn-helix domain-containing protein n=1 Tax=Paraburkholderia fungorum TaxID=134537 RepID=UPI001C1EBB66|nr:helix-turn-helix transcriptional regulator [Paraburkholderia fungorum]MBU7436491.1 helix-turn-helix domain-containing protein [Paraburkholderia fungorum]
MDTWNNRITEARELRRMKQADLARECGVSAPTVSSWESGGIKTLEASNMLTICRVLRIDPYWLVFGMDKSKAPVTDQKGSLSREAARLISWVERVDGLGGLAPKLFAHINAALQVAGGLAQEQNSPRDEDLAGAEEQLISHIDKPEGKQSANRKHKP